jgi:hypothetical protein
MSLSQTGSDCVSDREAYSAFTQLAFTSLYSLHMLIKILSAILSSTTVNMQRPSERDSKFRIQGSVIHVSDSFSPSWRSSQSTSSIGPAFVPTEAAEFS